MKYVTFFLFIIMGGLAHAQDNGTEPQRNDSLPPKIGKSVKPLKPGKSQPDSLSQISIKDYKIISHSRDTVVLDTTISIQKEYLYNYLRKDNFELQPLANVGHTYNRLGVSLSTTGLYPTIGATAKHYNYMEVDDIKYYNVPTPMTELMFKTTFEQGQLLDALLTFNTSPRFNFSIAYKGFRSMGKYQYNEMESGNFRVTSNYASKDGRYHLRAHIAAQDILGEENGGLLEKEAQFESQDPEFTDRSRMDVQFTDANNKILGKRYYLDHQYILYRGASDSTSKKPTALTFGHVFAYETKYYQFGQTAQNDFFGPAFLAPIDDKATLKTMYNQVNATFENRILGTLKGNVALYNYNYYFNSLLITDDGQVNNQLKGEEITLGAEYQKTIGRFALKGDLNYGLSGSLTGRLFNAAASYRIGKNHDLTFGIHSSSRMPNFNYLLYQSDYVNYNWQNSDTFLKQEVNGLRFNLDSKLLGNLMATYDIVDNYTYFMGTATPEQVEADTENATVRPFQETGSISHLKVKWGKEFRLGYFGLANTVMYQNVSQSSQILNVPQLVTRNTLFFTKDVFKKAMHLHTGITLKYFTAYNMDAYNPLLGEFYVQNREELGGFPMLDFFINAKVKQTRIFLKAEHFNSSFSENNFYSAPNYPYRDFVIRFGVVWNFFS
tara:strand:- start:270 stop:2264 length:1995 start_codon:yes stop_codon:yes gene_type:complete